MYTSFNKYKTVSQTRMLILTYIKLVLRDVY